jgi:hypothetical protein
VGQRDLGAKPTGARHIVAPMDTSRPTVGDVVVGVGAVVLIVSLFLPWYSVTFEAAGFSVSDTASGREALGFIDLPLFVIAAAAIALVAARAVGELPAHLPASRLVAGLGTAAVLLVLYRIVDIPTDGRVGADVALSREVGIFMALAGAAAVACGGWAGTPRLQNDQRRPEGRAAVGGWS